jgi:hypothetical protein
MGREIQTAVQIANMALKILQSDEIESFDEDSTTARAVKMYYFNVFSNCLMQHHWSFATKEQVLHPLADCPVKHRGYAYKLPIDLLSIIFLGDGKTPVPYELFSGDIACTDAAGPLKIKYIYNPPIEYLPSHFIDYFVHSLVEELSPVFGYNLEGQRVFHERIYGRNGKLGYAIRRDRGNGRPNDYFLRDSVCRARTW